MKHRAGELLTAPWCLELIAVEEVNSEDVRKHCDDLIEHLDVVSYSFSVGEAWLRQRERARKHDRPPRHVVWTWVAVLASCLLLGLGAWAVVGPWGLVAGLWLLLAILWLPLYLHSRYRKRLGLEHAPAEFSRATGDLDRRLREMIERSVWDAVEPQIATPDNDTVSMGEGDKLSSRALQSQRLATRSRSAVEGHLIRSGGATVGVTGERGIGKSEVLRSFCDDPAAKASVKQGGTIGVFVAVPAAFKGPEFLQLVTRRLIESIPGYLSHQEAADKRRFYGSIALAVLGMVVALLSFYFGEYLISGWGQLGPFVVQQPWAIGVGIGIAMYLIGIVFGSAIRRSINSSLSGTPKAGESSLKPVRNAVARHARTVMVRLRYAESMTSNVEGSATVGKFGLKRSTQRSLSALPLTEADLISEFAGLTEKLERAGYRVVVSIDEMDKLEPGESTEAFLNSVKQLFAVRSASFVVSVSSSAWSTFARRGVNVRDALDSSLDAIEPLAPLDFYEVRSLVRKRGERMTDSQVLFCQAFSGGLPREVLRCARTTAKVNDDLEGGQSLRIVARGVIEAEVKDLILSSIQQARSWDATPRDAAIALLMEYDRAWKHGRLTLAADPIDGLFPEVVQMSMQLRLRLLFLAALRHMFTDDPRITAEPETWRETAIVRAGELAQIGRKLESNPLEAAENLKELPTSSAVDEPTSESMPQSAYASQPFAG